MNKLFFRLPKTPPASLGKIYVFLFTAGVLLLGFFLGRNQTELLSTGDTVSVRQLKNMIAKGNITLVNVHTPYEGEIERTNAIIAFDKIVEQSSALPKDKNAPIILYCKSGRMSEEALLTIRKLGYTNVKHLSGGMEKWEQSGGKILTFRRLNLLFCRKTVLPSPLPGKT
jgi:rhodanese-related sulfurtransferase